MSDASLRLAAIDREISEVLFTCPRCGARHSGYPRACEGRRPRHAERSPMPKPMSRYVILYNPPPLDAVGLEILREVRGIQRGGWTPMGRVRGLAAAMRVLGTSSWSTAEGAVFRDMRGYVEVRYLRRYGEREDRDRAEFQLTGLGEAELDRETIA